MFSNTNQPHRPSGPEKLLTEKELATRWRMSVKVPQRMRSRGGGPKFIRLGRTIRYALSVVIAWEMARNYSSTSQYDHGRPRGNFDDDA